MKDMLHTYLTEWKALSILEKTFLLASIFMAWGFIHFDVTEVYFAKLGIPLQLPEFLGGITLTKKALYITEIYTLFFGILVLCRPSQIIEIWQQGWGTKPVLLTLITGFLFLGMCGALVDVGENPLRMVRNSSFVWYLGLSLVIFLLPIRGRVLELFFWCVHALAFFYLFASVFSNIGANIYRIYWVPFIGAIGFLSLALVAKRWWIALLILLPMGFGLAVNYLMGFQRTTLLGIIASAAFLFLWRKGLRLLILKRLIALGVFMVCFVAILDSGDVRGSAFSPSPFVKAPTDSKGAEIFRKQMWLDAWNLFREHPLFGIGFQKQVVYRTFQGNGFAPNEKYTFLEDQGAPISGPHNSYLNALARLGVWALILPLIHLLSVYYLWKSNLWAALALLVGQILYAFFNVGLENPGRSFFLLLCVGLALKRPSERDAAKPVPFNSLIH